MEIKSLLMAGLATLIFAACGSNAKNSNDAATCQSCAMPLVAERDFGTEADSTQSKDYCTYCYQDGAFTYDCTMEEMLGFCEQHINEIKPADMTTEAFMSLLPEVLPTLKRWKN